MNKIILILMILFISTHCYAISFNHQPYFQFEFGQQLEGEGSTDIAYIDVLFGYRMFFGYFKNEVYGELLNYYVWSDSYSGYPFRMIYTIGNRFYFNNWYIEIEHFCNHAVYTRDLEDAQYREAQYYWNTNKWTEARTTIAIGYKWN